VFDIIEDWDDDVEKGGGFFWNASEAPRSATAVAVSSIVPTAWEGPAEGFIAERCQYGGDIRG
jgi:hypothetical protein